MSQKLDNRHSPDSGRRVRQRAYTRVVSSCEELIARGIPVTYRDRVCELCGADISSEKAILCRRRRIELREAQMRDAEMDAVLPRWRRDGAHPALPRRAQEAQKLGMGKP